MTEWTDTPPNELPGQDWIEENCPKTWDGYHCFYDNKHPLARQGGAVLLHRHIMSIVEGRWLTAKDLVRFKDRNKDNISPENLNLVKLQKPMHRRDNRVTKKCALCGKEFKAPATRAGQWSHCSPECRAKSRQASKHPSSNDDIQELKKIKWSGVIPV
ncbi:MAG: hypothetical protein JEZ06_15060 [Anaerolineaceae bacterium]|nr:hypothetical protein [Anaerolineaceae bacterium]